MRDLISAVWTALNPVEPTTRYLVTFMAVIIGTMVLALLIGQLELG